MAGKVKVKMKTDRGVAKRFKKTVVVTTSAVTKTYVTSLQRKLASVSVSYVAWFV